MAIDASNQQAFIDHIASLIGRELSPDEVELAVALEPEKTAEVIARELEGAVIADPKKIRPEHTDAANE